MARGKKVTLSSSSSSSSKSTGQEGPSIRELLRNELGDNALYDECELLLSDKDLWALMLVEFSPELAERTQQVAVAEKLTVEEKVQVEVLSKDERRIREGIAAVLNKAPSQLTEADYEKVTELNLSGAPIHNIEFLAKLKNLQILDLSETQVKDISVLSSLTNLQRLDLNHTSVTDAGPLASLANLQGLSLWDTRVSDVRPFASIVSLQWLDLSGTIVTDVGALASIVSLEWLDLSSTPVSDVGPLAFITNLQMLDLVGTKVSDEQEAELKKALPKVEVIR